MDTASVVRWFSARYLILPGIYVGSIVVTIALSVGTPGGAYYRVLGLCPPVANLGMVFDNTMMIVGAFLVLGTPWWYMVGRIGWDSYDRREGILKPSLGAILALFTCFISTVMTFGNEDIHEGAVKIGVIVQYWLVSLLCLGALVSALFALRAALTPASKS